MNKGCQMILLCEDKQHEVFARHYLGFQPNQIRSLISPKGRNAAEQFVQREYPAQVKYYRNHRHYRSICLVVMTDADALSIEDRL